METTVAINALLDRLPDLHLDPAAPYPSINGVRSARRRRCRLSSHLPSRASWNIVADSLINGEVDAMSADSPVTGVRDQAPPRRARAGDRIAPDSSAGDHGEWPAT